MFVITTSENQTRILTIHRQPLQTLEKKTAIHHETERPETASIHFLETSFRRLANVIWSGFPATCVCWLGFPADVINRGKNPDIPLAKFRNQRDACDVVQGFVSS